METVIWIGLWLVATAVDIIVLTAAVYAVGHYLFGVW